MSPRADLYSKKMGELLLKGWRMLEEECPLTHDVPLMQHPQTGRKFSIAAGCYTDEMDGETNGSPTPPTSTAPSPGTSRPAAAVATAAATPGASSAAPPAQPPQGAGPAATAAASMREGRTEADGWCEEMSALMLKGWKMLGEQCPDTGKVPLMQHPVSGRKLSVATGRYTDQPRAPPHAASSPQPVPAAPHPTPVAPRAPTPPPPAAAAAAAAAAASAETPDVAVAALDTAARALADQLTECAKLLSRAAAPPPHGLVETMAQCADALAATERAKALYRAGPH